MRVTVAGQGALGRALVQTVLDSPHELGGLWVDPRSGDPVKAQIDTARWPDPPPAGDVLLLGDFGRVVSPEQRGAFQAVVNAHWSLLPRHRGRCPGAAAILAGDAVAGLTLHTVDDEVDRGRCLDQVSFPLGPRATRTALYLQAAGLVAQRLPGVLDRLPEVWGEPLGEGTWCPELTPATTRLDWTRPAEQLDRLVRAATTPAAWFVHDERGVRVSQASWSGEEVAQPPGTVVGHAGRRPVVATGSGTLRIERAWVPWHGVRWPWPGWSLPPIGATLG